MPLNYAVASGAVCRCRRSHASAEEYSVVVFFSVCEASRENERDDAGSKVFYSCGDHVSLPFGMSQGSMMSSPWIRKPTIISEKQWTRVSLLKSTSS